MTIPSKRILGIIPCSKEKIWDVQPHLEAVQAQYAYRSAFHRYAKDFVKKNCSQYLIFSAKYGFLSPEDWIEGPYDVTFSRPNDPYISETELARQAQKLQGFTEIWVVCPRTYAQKVESACMPFSPHFHFPLRGIGGFGAMHRFLRIQTA